MVRFKLLFELYWQLMNQHESLHGCKETVSIGSICFTVKLIFLGTVQNKECVNLHLILHQTAAHFLVSSSLCLCSINNDGDATLHCIMAPAYMYVCLEIPTDSETRLMGIVEGCRDVLIVKIQLGQYRIVGINYPRNRYG